MNFALLIKSFWYNFYMNDFKYKRVILKISGEALEDSSSRLILDATKLNSIGKMIKTLVDHKIKVGVVCGAGNIFRGRIAEEAGIDTIDGDYMGMTGTIINLKAISSILNKFNVENLLMSSLALEGVAIKYDEKVAKEAYEDGKVVLFAGGLGRPRITTDTTVARRALEMEADVILAGKNGVDGVYTADPNKDKNAKFIKEITYNDVIKMNLKVMDKEAIELLKDSDVATRVFSMEDMDNFIKVTKGDDLGTTIKKE